MFTLVYCENQQFTACWLKKKASLKLQVLHLFFLQVIAAPSFLSHLLEDKATQWLFGWTGSEVGVKLLLIGLILVALGVCFSIYSFFVKFHTEERKKGQYKNANIFQLSGTSTS